jgi:hypothetical protein
LFTFYWLNAICYEKCLLIALFELQERVKVFIKGTKKLLEIYTPYQRFKNYFVKTTHGNWFQSSLVWQKAFANIREICAKV